MCKWLRRTLRKCDASQMRRFANMQICKCENVQMSCAARFANATLREYANMPM